jgi:hypothetical protein
MAERLITMTLVDDTTLTTTVSGDPATLDERTMQIAGAIAGRGFVDSTTVEGTITFYPAHRIARLDITTPAPAPDPDPEPEE